MKRTTALLVILTINLTILGQNTHKKVLVKSTPTKEILPSFAYFEKSPYRLFYHTIKPNETPSSIAQLYNLPIADVMAMNNLKTNAILPVGQELLLEDRTQMRPVQMSELTTEAENTPPSVETFTLPPDEIIVSEVLDNVERDNLKILKIEDKDVAEPSYVHFIEAEDITRYQKQALQEHKMLFVNFYSERCVPCKMMQETVFKDQDIAVLINKNSINLHINGMTEQGKLQRINYNINAFPTLLFFNAQGEEVARHEGGLGITAFKDFMNMAFEKAQTSKNLSFRD